MEGDFETLINFLSFHHASDSADSRGYSPLCFYFHFPLIFPINYPGSADCAVRPDSHNGRL